MKKKPILLFLFIISLFNSCILNDFNESCSLTIQLVDTSGESIDNAKITYSTDYESSETTTNSKGVATINLDRSGICTVICSKDGFTAQTAHIIVLSKENRKTELILTALNEDAYLSVPSKEVTYRNTGGEFAYDITTNINYELECEASWLTCTKTDNGISVKCDSNQLLSPRTTTIYVRGAYNVNDSIKVTQLAGPVLSVENYLGKDLSSYPNNIPFITFSHEVSVVSAKALNTNIAYELSGDKKTVYFPNIKVDLFSTLAITLQVKASDNIELSFPVNLRLYANTQPMYNLQNRIVVFTNDNKYAWIYMNYNGYNQLKQYSLTNFTETTKSIYEQFTITAYNEYNNSIYLLNNIVNNNKDLTQVSIYDATTAVLKSRFNIDYNGLTVQSLAFTKNGYGLMQLGGRSLLYLNSANNHEYGIYSNSSNIYDSSNPNSLLTTNIATFKNSSMFMLSGTDSRGSLYVFSSAPGSKLLTQVSKVSGYNNALTSNTGTKAVLTNSSYNNLSVLDLETTAATTINLPGYDTNNLTFITNASGNQHLFTTNGRLISLTTNSVKTITTDINYQYMFSTSDGKFLIVNTRNKDFLFRSDLITEFANFIK